MRSPAITLFVLALRFECANAFTAGCASVSSLGVARRACVSAAEIEPAAPDGFAWAADDKSDETVGKVVPTNIEAAAAPAAPAAVPAPDPEPYYFQTPDPFADGLFAPLVRGAKRVLGEQELNQLRAKVITQHSKVITAFVDTSESKFGRLSLQKMFEYADKDGNGTLDREEVVAALKDLGFDFLTDKQVATVLSRADEDANGVIDFEEFVKETPDVLRKGLVKMAKNNGHDLGFLV